MNYTEHFRLSQWDKSDEIRMEDFNADNAKIDAALAAASSSSNSLGRSEHLAWGGGYSTGTATEFGKNFPSKINWNEWEYLAILVSYPSTANQNASLYFKLGTGGAYYENAVVSPLAMPGYLVMLLPRHDASQNVSGFVISDRLVPFSFGFNYTALVDYYFNVNGAALPYPKFDLYGAK